MKETVFLRYIMDVHNPVAFPLQIFAIHTSSDNCLWIATDSGGIAVYDEETDSFSHWTKKDGLISNSIFALTEDANKNIWAVSANGISIWDYTTKSWRQYLDHTRLRVSFALKNRIVELSEVKMQLESVNVKLETLAKRWTYRCK